MEQTNVHTVYKDQLSPDEIKQPNKKLRMTIALAVAAVLVVACLVVFLLVSIPLSAKDMIKEDIGYVSCIKTVYHPGTTALDTKAFDDISGEKQDQIKELLSGYEYSRTLKTLFSNDTSISGNLDEVLHIITADGKRYSFYDSDEARINGKYYRFHNAQDFIEKALAILEGE